MIRNEKWNSILVKLESCWSCKFWVFIHPSNDIIRRNPIQLVLWGYLFLTIFFTLTKSINEKHQSIKNWLVAINALLSHLKARRRIYGTWYQVSDSVCLCTRWRPRIRLYNLTDKSKEVVSRFERAMLNGASWLALQKMSQKALRG